MPIDQLIVSKYVSVVDFWNHATAYKQSVNEFKSHRYLCVLWVRTRTCYGRSRGGAGGLVEPPKLNVKTYNKRVVKKKVNQGDLRAIKPLQIAPENTGNLFARLSEPPFVKSWIRPRHAGIMHTCQLSRFSRESPSFSSNLPVSRLEHQISWELPTMALFTFLIY